MTRLALSILTVAALTLAYLGCSGQQAGNPPGKLFVVATTGMIGDAARVIGGEHIDLAVLMGPGVDPHLYKTSKGDLDLLDRADIVFYNGLNLEAKMAEILKKMSGGKTTVALGEALPDSVLRFPTDFEGHPDPHIWFDVALWRQAVQSVGETLAAKDTAHAVNYRDNLAAYLNELDTLHSWTAEQIASISEDQRILVTAHDAFGYFGRAYGIEVLGLQGISTVTEAGLYDVTEMVNLLVDRKIRAVFVESSVPPKAIQSVVDGCRARGHEVKIGGELFSDAMGAEGTPEGTYVGMVRHNVSTIVEALR